MPIKIAAPAMDSSTPATFCESVLKVSASVRPTPRFSGISSTCSGMVHLLAYPPLSPARSSVLRSSGVTEPPAGSHDENGHSEQQAHPLHDQESHVCTPLEHLQGRRQEPDRSVEATVQEHAQQDALGVVVHPGV